MIRRFNVGIRHKDGIGIPGEMVEHPQGEYVRFEDVAALQERSEDAVWMACESRRPWVTNSLKHHAKELRDAEKRSRSAFKKDYMGEPACYLADAFGAAAALIEAKLSAIDHAHRRIEGETK